MISSHHSSSVNTDEVSSNVPIGTCSAHPQPTSQTSHSADSDIPGISLYQVLTRQRLVNSGLEQHSVSGSQRQLDSDIQGSLHDFRSFIPPARTPESPMSSFPLDVVYETSTKENAEEGKPKKIPITRLAHRRSVHSIRRHQQRA